MAINQKRSLLHIQSFIICLFIRSEEKEQKIRPKPRERKKNNWNENSTNSIQLNQQSEQRDADRTFVDHFEKEKDDLLNGDNR